MLDEIGELMIDGNLVKENPEINESIRAFYTNLYGNNDEILELNYDQNFFRNVAKISDEDGQQAWSPINLEELTSTLNACKDSAPGPDGIPYSFLKAIWHKMGPALLNAWEHSQKTGVLAPSHKKLLLKLIPKLEKTLRK